MHHIALNRPGPDNRHLYNKIMKTAWLQTRQHRHLSARFHLKHANGLALAQHIISCQIFWRHRGQRQMPVIMQLQ